MATDPEGHLHVLTAPDLHLVVVWSNVFKVLLWDGEEATGESGSSEGWQENTHIQNS